MDTLARVQRVASGVRFIRNVLLDFGKRIRQQIFCVDNVVLGLQIDPGLWRCSKEGGETQRSVRSDSS